MKKYVIQIGPVPVNVVSAIVTLSIQQEWEYFGALYAGSIKPVSKLVNFTPKREQSAIPAYFVMIGKQFNDVHEIKPPDLSGLGINVEMTIAGEEKKENKKPV